jgi:hypothetical protein
MKRRIAAAGAGLLIALGLFCRGDAAAQGAPGGESDFIGPAMSLADAPVAPGGGRLTLVGPDGSLAHIQPTVARYQTYRRANPAVGTGPLLYHGGPVMPTLTIHRIFWAPPRLQNGAPAVMSQDYINILSSLTVDYPGHGIDNNNTQYFQIKGGVKTFIQNAGSAPKGFVDNLTPYPASVCHDPATPGNCVTDAQMRAEIKKIMTAEHWAAGLNSIFVLYTASGEGSCITAGACAYTTYCAYHSAFGNTNAPLIYAIIPFGDPTDCIPSGTPSPNNDPPADSAASSTSHEITEAVTDPTGHGWFGSGAESEIGDLCFLTFGPPSWGRANQMWNGHLYELQTEYDNHIGGCVQIGP